MDASNFQEVIHSRDWDYRGGSPHLKHARLKDELTAWVRAKLQKGAAEGLPRTVLEVGAGDGGYTEPILASGYDVTATEVSQASVDRLNDRFGENPNFRAVHDPDGSLGGVELTRFGAILCVSLLHHVPDYLSFIDSAVSDHLLDGGSFISLQDPLWYPTLGAGTRRFSRLAFLSWRITQGNYRQGFGTQIRRCRGVYDDTKPGDVVEYHAVRQGVDQVALVDLLSPKFAEVQVIPYWSTQASIWQEVGHSLGLKNTFALVASRRLASSKFD